MKKYLSLLFMAMVTIVSCQKFDDSEIWDKLNDHETRIAYLEEVCKNMNTSIVNLQTVVTALETNDYIISASPLVTGDGYTFLFKSGKSIVIYNGKDGQNGTNGKDGVTPVISVKQDTDGYYYWTVDGEWLIVDGKKVKASATDGENGENGTNGIDGITPKFKIEEDYWYVSYDNGKSWEKLGKATGSNGLNGEDGDTLFNRVYIEDGYVCFELNNDTKTVIRVPLMKDGTLSISLEKEGTLSKCLSSEESRTVTSLTLKGKINFDDLRYLQVMNSLQTVDLSGTDFVQNANGYGGFKLNPYRDTLINKSITEVVLPKFTEGISTSFSHCLALRKVVVTSDVTSFGTAPDSFQEGNSQEYLEHNRKITLCPLFEELEYAEGVTKLYEYNEYHQLNKIIYPSTMKYIPTGLTSFSNYITESSNYGSTKYYHYYYTLPCKILICKAVTPPVIESTRMTYDTVNKWYHYMDDTWSSGDRYYYYKVNVPSDATLYVPSESIEAYKKAPIWDNFTNILPLESLEN